RDIASRDCEAGHFLCTGGKRLVVDVADKDVCALGHKGTRKLSADAGGPGRYQYTLRHDSEGDQTTTRLARQWASRSALTGAHIGFANRLTFFRSDSDFFRNCAPGQPVPGASLY